MREPVKRDISQKLFKKAWNKWCNFSNASGVYQYISFRDTLIKVLKRARVKSDITLVSMYVKYARKKNQSHRNEWWYEYIK